MSDQGSEAARPGSDLGAGSFEPAPQPHPSWRSAFVGRSDDDDVMTPERWIEQRPAAADPEPGPPEPPGPARPSGRGFVALLMAICLASALLAAGGTYAVLNSAGALNGVAAAPSGGTGAGLQVESGSSEIIAAVAKVSPATVQIVANDGQGDTAVGAGIIYDVRGWILTNKHVVNGAKTITVRIADDRRATATLYGIDTLTDLAIVKMSGVVDISAAPLGDSSSLLVGQLAIAIGSPLGLAYPNTVTEGIVSALGRDITVAGDTPATAGATTSLHGLIQTDAAINPGNSGGPLVDATGKVIGINTASAQTAAGIGFAIPINIAKPIMQQALAGEKLSRPFIGVSYSLITKALAAQNNLPLQQGAWVHKEDTSGTAVPAVTVGSPGEAAGIRTGDIITALEGQQVDALHRLEDLLVQYSPGRTITVQLYRDGGYLTVRVTLGTRPDNLG
jgi:S1-C subfamily serine protease